MRLELEEAEEGEIESNDGNGKVSAVDDRSRGADGPNAKEDEYESDLGRSSNSNISSTPNGPIVANYNSTATNGNMPVARRAVMMPPQGQQFYVVRMPCTVLYYATIE